MINKLRSAALATVALLSVSGAAAAVGITNPATTTFDVTLHIDDECLVGTVGAMDFGSTGFITVDLEATTVVDVGCTKDTVATVKLSDGDNYSGGARHMSNGTDEIAYGLYTDIGHSAEWTSALATQQVTGDGTAVAGVPATNQSLTIYGLVPASNSNYSTGDYADEIRVDVEF
jgi:spore coat protein U-like protein